MKVILGLGNPGARYDDTRHNVGWWMVDRLAFDWDLGSFDRRGSVLTVEGSVDGHGVRLLKPLTYVNRSGAALASLSDLEDFDPSRDLLVVVDDAALDVGRVRFRPGGGAGGHKGLLSIQSALGRDRYCRLRIGVGAPPQGAELSDWVLSPLDAEDEEVVVDLLAELTGAVETWISEGVEKAMNQYNR